jgi:hypothetical protein
MVYTHPKVVSYYKNFAGEVPTNRANPDDYEQRP